MLTSQRNRSWQMPGTFHSSFLFSDFKLSILRVSEKEFRVQLPTFSELSISYVCKFLGTEISTSRGDSESRFFLWEKASLQSVSKSVMISFDFWLKIEKSGEDQLDWPSKVGQKKKEINISKKNSGKIILL